MVELAITGLTLRQHNRDSLKGVSLALADGKVTALYGPAGSGKSALLRAVAGLDWPQAGTIRIGDRLVFDATSRTVVPPHERKAGLMFQSAALWPRWTVFDNVIQGTNADDDQGHATARVSKLLGELGLTDLAQHKPPQLSAEERMRTALARALADEPAVLLLDEPLAALDPWRRDAARAWLCQLLVKLDIPALVATTREDEALSIGDRIALIRNGMIEQEGTPAELYSEPRTLFAAEFMSQNNRIEGPLIEKAGPRAFITVLGNRIGGI